MGDVNDDESAVMWTLRLADATTLRDREGWEASSPVRVLARRDRCQMGNHYSPDLRRGQQHPKGEALISRGQPW